MWLVYAIAALAMVYTQHLGWIILILEFAAVLLMKNWRLTRAMIFAFAAIPLVPFDAAGIIAGALRYPLWKFLLIGWAGKTIKFIALVYAAMWGWNILLRYIGG